MNHLGVDGNMRVVFDAGDSMLTREGEDVEESEEIIDLSQLRSEDDVKASRSSKASQEISYLLSAHWRAKPSLTHLRHFPSHATWLLLLMQPCYKIHFAMAILHQYLQMRLSEGIATTRALQTNQWTASQTCPKPGRYKIFSLEIKP